MPAGTYTFFLKANSTNSSFMLRGQGGFTGTVDNVSVKEVLGNHAIQTTSVNRPVLARHPEGGIRNLLSYTQEFDDAFGLKWQPRVTANATTAPRRYTTADKVIAAYSYLVSTFDHLLQYCRGYRHLVPTLRSRLWIMFSVLGTSAFILLRFYLLRRQV